MLQSHLHSLIAKAHRYQAEPERFERTNEEPFQVSVHGANGEHQVRPRRTAGCSCDCDGFAHRGEGICAHVLGVEHHFRDQLPPTTRSPGPSPRPPEATLEHGALDRVQFGRQLERAIRVLRARCPDSASASLVVARP